jgi:hypothetical protein
MQRILITIQYHASALQQEWEVPATIPLQDLLIPLAQLIGERTGTEMQPSALTLYTTPPHRILHPRESLAQAGVWDGGIIHIEVAAGAADQFASYLLSGTGQQYPLIQEKMEIGRLGRHSAPTERTIPLIDLSGEPSGNTVSRNHATIFYDKEQWYLATEEGAVNATTLNNQPVAPQTPQELTHGDYLQFGGVGLHFYTDVL